MLPDVFHIQTWLELSKDAVSVRDGRVFPLQTDFAPHQWTFSDLTSFVQCVEDGLDVIKLVKFSVLSAQGWVLSSLLPRQFVTKPMEDLVAPFLGVFALLRVNVWTVRDSEEYVLVRYVTVVTSWSGEKFVVEELEAVDVSGFHGMDFCPVEVHSWVCYIRWVTASILYCRRMVLSWWLWVRIVWIVLYLLWIVTPASSEVVCTITSRTWLRPLHVNLCIFRFV